MNWVLDADIRALLRQRSTIGLAAESLVEHQDSGLEVDACVSSRKWLSAGTGGDRAAGRQEHGMGRATGATVSPLLANIYLHYVFDLWARRWRNRCALGDVVFVRYATDNLVAGFQHES